MIHYQFPQVTNKAKLKEVYGPGLAHLTKIATANMQMLSNILPILSLQLMKGSSFEQFLVFKKKSVFFSVIFIPYWYIGMTVNEARPFEQTLNPISTEGSI